MEVSPANATAKTLKELHRPHHPLILANVYDVLTARTVAELPSCRALATASYAVARANGTSDDDMTLETNVEACRSIAAVAREFGKPLTVDAQDLYGNRLEEAVGRLIDMGVSGVNLEDTDKETGKLRSVDEAVSRIERALTVARYKGVPDFVINARCDVLMRGGELEEVLRRGKAYLEAGATSVFVLGSPKPGVPRAEVVEMAKAFDGRLNVTTNLTDPDRVTIKELSEIGVSRISVGPALQYFAMATYAKEAKKLLDGEY